MSSGRRRGRTGIVLRGERVALTPIKEGDASALFDWINERGQVLFNAPYKPVHEGQHREWLATLQRRDDIVIFGITRLEDSGLIGTCQLHSINLVHRAAELQIRIGDTGSRGKGYGTEAVLLLLKFGFNDLNLHRIYLHVFETNSVAIATYKRVGFTQEGVLREAAHIDGRRQNVAVMGILHHEYVVPR